jgi:hypothetical protein
MTIYGWDMSHFDAPSIGSALSEGISFFTHKAGGDAVDTELPTWWNGVKRSNPASTLLGAYWVLYPGSPSARADAFIARLDDVCPGWRDREFILQADCEKWGGKDTTVPSIAEINTFCDRLVNRMPKLRPIVYAPEWVYGSKVSGLSYPLWSSKYVTGAGPFKSLYPSDTASQWSTYGGKRPAILQYTSSATIGGQTTCDANAYRGTFEGLKALVAPGWSDEVSAADVVAGLQQFFGVQSGVPAARAGSGDTDPENMIGTDTWSQPMPNPWKPKNADGTSQRTPMWIFFEDMASAITALGSLSPTQMDPSAFATKLMELGIGEAVASALIAQLGAKSVGTN